MTLPVEAVATAEPGGDPQDLIDAAELAGLAAAADHPRPMVRIFGDA
jgi:hypothetical protein